MLDSADCMGDSVDENVNEVGLIVVALPPKAEQSSVENLSIFGGGFG